MRTIQIDYQPTKGAHATQYWLPLLNTYFSIGQHSMEGLAQRYTEFVQTTKALTLQSAPIELIPVTVPRIDQTHNRLIYCGYRPKTTEPAIQPIVIRGKELPELKGTVSHNQIHFTSMAYNNPLTDGQRDTLNAWFGEELKNQITPKLLNILVERVLKTAKKAVDDELSKTEEAILKVRAAIRKSEEEEDAA